MKIISMRAEQEKIRFSAGLLQRPVLIKQLKEFWGDLKFYCQLNPPVFIGGEGEYVLVARHYSYDVFLDHALQDGLMPACIIEVSELPQMLEIEGIEIEIFTRILSRRTKEHLRRALLAVKASRRKHRNAGMICPLCGSILQGPKWRRSIEDGNHKGHYLITCYRKSDRKNPCGFKTYFKKEEMDLFLRREYPTSKWLVETSERCEKCGKRMFLRIVGNIKYLACEDCVRKDGHCKNYKKIDEVKS